MAGLQRETPLTAFSDLVKEWEKCVAQGTSRLTQIANANQKLSHADGESWAGLADANALHVTLRHKLEREAHQCWQHLSDILDQLGDIIVNMRALCFLDVSSSSQDYEIDPTLSRLHYDLYLQQLVEMYQQELMAKALIAVDIVECYDHDTAVVYIASWQMQPFVNKPKQDDLAQLLAPPAAKKPESTHKLVK
ncbi:hypothetical protein H257_09551 [Aphanomyces astaci]|uniref:Uncharacterized protein n=1 Tax=Aphanomyces astaci TaxID=112090 RepID=W4GBX5_APHAT|nr:hypothetical protein H257_09551 [Aphanomyces astaci]ETV76549.1 hypothetical protein H257_09551 [Aphanomyces astaci]|eukprot:XP_009834094.1 hypothetical protein H257_09551 [Aphanomyces astaci]